MRRPVLYLLLLLFCRVVTTAQSNQMLRTQIYHAEKNKDWHSASQYYNRLYMRDSSDVKMNYRYAEACRLNFEVDMALRLYRRIAAQDEKLRYPLCKYHIGHLLKMQGKYKEAKRSFSDFTRLPLKKEKYLKYLGRAKREMDACDVAVFLVKNPVDISIKHLATPVNSRLSEYAPYEKDSMLYFSSIRVPEKLEPGEEVPAFSKIYTSQIRRGKLQKLKALDTAMNANRQHNANVCFSPDMKEMVITRCKSLNAAEYQCELYLSRFVNKRWQTPERMEEPVNQPSVNTTQANFGIMEGKTTLFFASNREGGVGGLDIWYSVRNEDGIFARPLNAGRAVNSQDDEVSPWFDSKAQALYFSSTYHKGLGAMDIFRSNFEYGKFTAPANAGSPINSGYNDLYYSVNNLGTRVYLSSNRVGSMFEGKLNCCSDIYSFNIDTAKPPPEPVKVDTAAITREQVKLLVPLTLYFNNDQPDPGTRDTTTHQTYDATYTVYAATQKKYEQEYSRGLKGDEKNYAVKDIQRFFNDSLVSGFQDLQRFTELLEKVMNNGETVKITMKGYCSPLASSDYNIRLAKRRISSLRNYFLTVNGGYFAKHVNSTAEGGKIIFENVDIGELTRTRASDNASDKRNSIYNPFAASERKIQIIAVSFGTQ